MRPTAAPPRLLSAEDASKVSKCRILNAVANGRIMVHERSVG